MEQPKRNYMLEFNLLYLIVAIILISLGSIVQSREIYTGLLITEFIIILLPCIIYLKTTDTPLKETLRLNKINFKQLFFIIAITFVSYPIAVFLNSIVLNIINLFGETLGSSVPLPNNSSVYMLSLLIIGIAPGICEEVMFRGVMLNIYSNIGKRKAIFYSAILFGLLHLNIQNLVGPIFLGIVMGILVEKTNSLYASIIGHSLNNMIAMTLGYLTMINQKSIDEVPAYDIPYIIQLIITLVFIGIIAMVCLFILSKLLKHMPVTEGKRYKIFKQNEIHRFSYLPILVFIIIFIYINSRFLFL